MSIDTVVLHSGGMDSTVLLYKAIEEGKRVLSLGINYGQTHRIELEYAANQCKKLSIKRKVITIAWDKPLREMPLDREKDEIGSNISPAFLPGRNIVFLSLACSEASGVGASEVWVGVNSIDFSGYPDCTPEFVSSFKDMLALGMPNGPKVVAPLQLSSKEEIAREAHRLGLDIGDTWSCYRPHFSKIGITPCGRCDACILHAHAWDGLV